MQYYAWLGSVFTALQCTSTDSESHISCKEKRNGYWGGNHSERNKEAGTRWEKIFNTEGEETAHGDNSFKEFDCEERSKDKLLSGQRCRGGVGGVFM